MELNRYIDHTLLKADATPEQIAKLCAEAKEYRFASVCVNSCCGKAAQRHGYEGMLRGGLPAGRMLKRSQGRGDPPCR
mgnify:CR=1 FL=1